MINKVAIINVYFGKLPQWFQLWLDSCRYNKEFTWLIFTNDNTEYEYPENVVRYLCDFDWIKEKITKKLKLDIKITNPYKLCDFKTVYGNIFEDYLKEFTHWGYCDIDVIFGDISKYITDDILNKYDRVLNKGHLSIYKNNEVVKKYYMLPYSGISYKEVFESHYHYGFDEIAGLDKLYIENNIEQYIPNKWVFADINYSNYKFNINGYKNYNKQCFIWENGKVFRYYYHDGREYIEEFAYIHFQKRKLAVNNNNNNKYCISPVGFVDFTTLDKMYELNNNKIIKLFQRKYNYYKLILKQKIYRFLHWKIRI